jgi:hypothetical protein
MSSMATEKGLAVTIKGFIPVDPHNLAGHRAALDAVMKAQAGELAAIDGLILVDDFRAEPVVRRKRDEPAKTEG